MRRRRHWLFNLATAASLAIGLAAVFIWPWSYFRNQSAGVDYLRWLDVMRYRMDSFSVATRNGVFFFNHRAILYDFGKSVADAKAYRLQRPGGFEYGAESVVPDPNDHWPAERYGFGWTRKKQSFQNRAFDFSFPDFGTNTEWLMNLALPAWAVLFVTLLLPGFWIVHRKRAAVRLHRGLCAVCGYDLRATPDKCPECGAIPTAANGAAP